MSLTRNEKVGAILGGIPIVSAISGSVKAIKTFQHYKICKVTPNINVTNTHFTDLTARRVLNNTPEKNKLLKAYKIEFIYDLAEILPVIGNCISIGRSIYCYKTLKSYNNSISESEAPSTPAIRITDLTKIENPEEFRSTFFNFLGKPSGFIETLEYNDSYLIGTPFFECPCMAPGRATSPIRKTLEELIIKDISDRFINKENTLRLVSLGSGGLLQDLIIVGKLIKAGYHHIEITFFEIIRGPYKEFESFLNKIPNVSVKTNWIPYHEKKPEHDFSFAIDYDQLNQPGSTCWETLFQVQSNLSENGRLYLYGDNTHAIFEKQQMVDLTDQSGMVLDQIRRFAEELSPDHLESIQVTVLKRSPNFNLVGIALIIQFLEGKFKKPIHVQLAGKGRGSTFTLPNENNISFLKQLSGIESLKVTCSDNVETISPSSRTLQVDLNDGNTLFLQF